MSWSALGTTIQIDFTGILTGTVDRTGTIFRNGTADNSGAGTEITGHIVWDLSKPGQRGHSSTFSLYDYDTGGGSPHSPGDSAIHWDIGVAGIEFGSDLKLWLAQHCDLLRR